MVSVTILTSQCTRYSYGMIRIKTDIWSAVRWHRLSPTQTSESLMRTWRLNGSIETLRTNWHTKISEERVKNQRSSVQYVNTRGPSLATRTSKRSSCAPTGGSLTRSATAGATPMSSSTTWRRTGGSRSSPSNELSSRNSWMPTKTAKLSIKSSKTTSRPCPKTISRIAWAPTEPEVWTRCRNLRTNWTRCC